MKIVSIVGARRSSRALRSPAENYEESRYIPGSTMVRIYDAKRA